MGRYFPPSLQARGTAVKGGGQGQPYNTGGFTEIFFNMPAQNDVNALFGIDGSPGGHVQFTLKTKHNNTTALDSAYTPDYVTIYFNAKTNYSPNGSPLTSAPRAQIIYYGADLYSLYFSNSLYRNPNNTLEVGPIADTDYTIQIRFGDHQLGVATQWSPYPAEVNGLQLNFTGFANWRANAVALGEFGEWSNTQTFYAYGRYSVSLTQDSSKWLPTYIFSYNTQFDDEIVDVEVRYEYILPSGEVKLQVENFSGDLGTPGHFELRRSVNIAPTDTLYVMVVARTKHNTILNDPDYSSYMPANPERNGIIFGPYPSNVRAGGKIDDGDPTLPMGTLGREPLLVSEERKDGVIAKRILSPVISGADAPYSLNIYRFDYYTREAVLIASGIDLSAGAAPYIFKDYCVEMGTRYQYAGLIQGASGAEGPMLWEMFSPFTSGSNPYAELDKLEFSVLTSRYCQLRFQGNPAVSNFKREVQESFQTTIGSEYPFYSRVGKSNYRTLSFSGVVSINFDFTSLFLELDSTNTSYEKRGLLWEKNLVVPIEKVYEQQQVSLNRRRFSVNSPFVAVTAAQDEQSGPDTIHDEKLLASRKKKYNTQQTSDMIYLERIFREKAMRWLSDGKPKLFRSETEGNMIVIASGATFTPLEGSQRMVYTVQMTLTEIAEYNLANLLTYNLLPCEIIADVEPIDVEYPGDYDPNYSDGILRFPDSDSYDIPSVQNGRPIPPILIGYEPGLRVTGGTPPYTFEVLEIPNPAINLHWEQINRNGIECLRIYGYPLSNLPPRVFTARVRDSVGTTAQIQFQFGGTSSSGSVFSIDTIEPVVYDGTAKRPAVIVRENGAQITPTSVQYSNNTNAGIATVTVTLPTGGTLVQSFNILPKTITVTQGSLRVTKVYDGTIGSATATVSGAPGTSASIAPATISVTTGQFTTKTAGTNKAITIGFSLQGAAAPNYTLNPATAVWNVGVITPKPITVTPNANQSKVYGTNDPGLTYTVSPNLASGDNIGGALTRAPGSTVGTYAITIGTLTAGTNYTLTFTSGVLFTITKAAAPTLQWPQSTGIIYGQTLATAMSPVSNNFGTFNWNTPSIVPPVSNTGYPVTFTPIDTVNYDWPSNLTRTVAVAVSRKQLTLTGITVVNKVYDGTTNIALTGGTLNGIVGTDAVTPVIGAATVSNKNVGNSKPVTFTVDIAGADSGNYTVVLEATPTVNITQKTVTIVSAVGRDRSYNGFNTVDVDVTIGGVISGDNLQTTYMLVGQISSPMPAGNVPVVATLQLVGNDRANYAAPPITATVNITKATQAPPPIPTLVSVSTNTITVHEDASQEFSIDNGVTWQDSGIFTGLDPLTNYQIIARYKETTILLASNPSPPRNVTTNALDIDYTVIGFVGTYDGNQHGVTATLEPTASIRYSADNGLTYTLTASPTFRNAGTYTVYYQVTKPGASTGGGTQQVIISPLTVTVTADNKSKSLGEPDPELTYSVTPSLAAGDSFTGSLIRAAGETAGNYPILQGSLSLSANYNISYAGAILNIGGATVTITPDAGQSKLYQQADPTPFTFTFTPALQPGDSFSGSLSRTEGENVGTYNFIIGTLTAPSSYSLVLEPEVFTINPVPITVTADAKTKVFGQPDPALTYVITPSSATASLTGALSRTLGENFGNYPITQGSLDNPNFDITYSGNILSITKAPITRTIESYVNTHEYTGSPIEPPIQVIDSLTSIPLVQDTDYTVDYLQNTNVGTGTIVVTGIGNYQLTKNLNFQITPVVTTLTIEPIGDFEYTGNPIAPLPVVKDGTRILQIDVDYTVDYPGDNVNAGQVTLVVNGIGAYMGNSATAFFNINKAAYASEITNGTSFSRVFAPTPPSITPVISRNPEGGTVVTMYATSAGGTYSTVAPVNAGSYFVKAQIGETENYLSVETDPVAFTISPLVTTFTTFSSISGITIIYDGNAYDAGIPVVNGTTLIKDTDYTLSPNSPAVNVGTHSWVYTGINNYAGSNGSFLLIINPRQLAIQLLGASAKLFGDPDPVFAYNSGALIGSDTITGVAGRVPGEDVGNYLLTIGTLTAGPNYELTLAPSSATTFTISPRPLSDFVADWTPGDISINEFSHTGAAITPTVENWNAVADPIVSYAYYDDTDTDIGSPVDVGTYKAVATSTSSNTSGGISFDFQIS